MHADNTRSDSTAVLDVYCGSYDIFENYRLEGRGMREQKHRLIRTFTAVALMFTAFFATLFGFLTLDRADARAAGEAVRLSVALQPDQYIIDGMTPEQVASTSQRSTITGRPSTRCHTIRSGQRDFLFPARLPSVPVCRRSATL